MRRMHFLAACFLAVVSVAQLGAAEGPFVFIPDVRLWGADLTVGYRGWRMLPGLDTVLWAHVGGGWESHAFYRSHAEGDAVGEPVSADDPNAAYKMLTADWQLGLAQGILWSNALGRNLLELVLQSRFRVEGYRPGPGGEETYLLGSVAAADDGLVQLSGLVALHLDGVRTSEARRTHNGVDAEVSLEMADTFNRVNAHIFGLVTLVDNVHVALVAGSRLEWDVVFASGAASMPVWARTTLGGLNPDKYGGESGLGGAVRGVSSERFDGALKIVSNTELRLLFPEILPLSIFPGLIAFVDLGTSDWRALDRTPVLPRDLVVSAGLGLDLRVLVADLVLYGSYCFAPEEGRGFEVDFRFSTQF